ncbi:MAG: hypothetical protein PHP62_05755 [Candidatus Moranbacteria bacterium]|nr:hypothetical protein [Candidatus Moranbacteria bacterium]
MLKKTLIFWLIFITLFGCTQQKYVNYHEVEFEELEPFFLVYPTNELIVINSFQDLENLNKTSVVQQEYEKFFGDGVKTTFNLPYKPVDTGKDGRLGFEDFAIYYNGGLLTNESAAKIMTIDATSGEIKFFTPPKDGDFFTISGHDYMKPPNVTLIEKLDFANKTYLGRKVEVGGCTVDFEKKILRNDNEKKAVYIINVISKGNCESVRTSFNWVAVPKILNDFQISSEVNITRN